MGITHGNLWFESTTSGKAGGLKSREPLKAVYAWEPLQAACLVNRSKRSLVSRRMAAITTTPVDLDVYLQPPACGYTRG
jgi:hypothetical protein